MWFQRSKRKSQTPSEGPSAQNTEHHPSSSSSSSSAAADVPLPASASTLSSSSSAPATPHSPGTSRKPSGKGASPSPKTPTKRRGSSGHVPNSPSVVSTKTSGTSSSSALGSAASSSSSGLSSPAPASSPSERGENVYIRSVDDLAMLDRPITLKDVENLKEEFDRKIRVLSQCLEEKAEENVTMHEQLESQNKKVNDLKQRLQQSSDIENLVSEMNALLRIKEDETQQLHKNIVQKDQDCKRLTELNDEYSRRIQVLSECLSEMAEENMAFSRPSPAPSSSSSTIRSHILPSASSTSSAVLSSLEKAPQQTTSTSSSSGPEKEAPKPEDLSAHQSGPSLGTSTGNAIQQTATAAMAAAAAASDAARKQLEERLSVLQEEHDALRTQMQTQEKRIVQLNTKLMESVNKQTASEESNKMYEKKLKSLEKEMLDNLRQEGARRQEAEYQASKLKKRLAELQFLLDERDQDDDDDDDDDDEGDETDDD